MQSLAKFFQPTSVVPRLRQAFIAGGAAGALTLTGIKVASDFLVGVLRLRPGSSTGVATGRYTVTAADNTANAFSIVTGLASIASHTLFVRSSAGAVLALTGAVVTVTGGTITVTDGGVFACGTGDLVDWTASVAAAPSGAFGTPSDLLSEFTVSADDTITNAGGTATTGDVLLVTWFDNDWGERTAAY